MDRRGGMDSLIYKFGTQGVFRVQMVNVEPWVEIS